ncbi:mobB [Klebsiella pneumoniae]|uniref:MobB n=1 Tax=Klebsiella pneumoniae TaxID=573 RepID=A0A2X3IKI1_KLEPN|nr:mobB [Klebsiella pneumoniae]
MRFVGLSQKEWREYAERYKRDNNRAAPFSVLASLDSPGRMVRARRHVWNYAYWLTGAAGLALLGGLVVAVLSRAGEKPSCVRTSTRTQIITCCSRLTCSG